MRPNAVEVRCGLLDEFTINFNRWDGIYLYGFTLPVARMGCAVCTASRDRVVQLVEPHVVVQHILYCKASQVGVT